MVSNASAPVGVFDSGVGGLTVLSALVRALPHEDFLYLGDTARLPYGSKPADMVRGFATELATELVARGVKAVVVACNTAAAASLPELATSAPVPIWGVVEPGVSAALAAHQASGSRGTVGVLGTSGTIRAGTYQRALRAAGVPVWDRACPLFVPLVEEGVSHGEIARLVAERYLHDRPADLSTLILGCTHYPALSSTLAELLGPEVRLVDSAESTAAAVAQGLAAHGLLRPPSGRGLVEHRVTGDLVSFVEVARILGGPEGSVLPLSHPLPVRPAWPVAEAATA